MNTIQVSEESAIIPLAKLNEYKETQSKFMAVLANQEKFIKVIEIVDYTPIGCNVTIRFYTSSEMEIKWENEKSIDQFKRDHYRDTKELSNTIQDLSGQLKDAKKTIEMLKVSKATESKWYQFWKK